MIGGKEAYGGNSENQSPKKMEFSKRNNIMYFKEESTRIKSEKKWIPWAVTQGVNGEKTKASRGCTYRKNERQPA